jgi:hypothetical protein
MVRLQLLALSALVTIPLGHGLTPQATATWTVMLRRVGPVHLGAPVGQAARAGAGKSPTALRNPEEPVWGTLGSRGPQSLSMFGS